MHIYYWKIMIYDGYFRWAVYLSYSCLAVVLC